MRNKVLITALLIFIGAGLFAQSEDDRISVEFKNITVSDLIDSVRNISGIKIAYDVSAIPVDSMVSIKAENIYPLELLRSVLKNDDLEILDESGQVIIRKKIRKAGKYFRIHGKVTGDKGQPLPWVNISFKNIALGTISNRSGDYEIRIPYEYSGDSLFFSALGYGVRGVPVSPKDTLVNVVLDESVITLPEVVIKYKKADEIINRFIKNRGKNYFEKKVLFTAFFRETIMQDDKYVNVSEAVLNILKFPYDKPFQFEYVKFIKGRKYDDVEKMKYVNLKVEGGPYYFSRIDIARYQDFFPDENGNTLYRYKLKGLDYQYDKLVYVVSFEPYTDTGELLYEGVMRFDASSYALVSAELKLSKNTLRKSRKYLIKKESGHIKARPFYAGYSISYRPFNGMWVLNKVIGELKIKITDKKNGNKSTFSALSEMLYSDFKDAGDLKFRQSEMYRSNYVLSEKIDSYDPDFWKNYNVIKPGEDIENVFKKNTLKQDKNKGSSE